LNPADSTNTTATAIANDSETPGGFAPLGLAKPLLDAIHAEGYHTPTPIQSKTIQPILEGRDLVGCAQTGTGKTAAFALPTLQRLGEKRDEHHSSNSVTTPAAKADAAFGSDLPDPFAPQKKPGRGSRAGRRMPRRPIRALVLAPTRELAAQIGESFASYGRFTHVRGTVIFGGVSQKPQEHALQSGVDVLVATPGRLLDLMQQGLVDLRKVEILILDEADRMLDMGFIDALRRIVSRVPKERQTLMFSATMPGEIRGLTRQWLRSPVHVQVCPISSPAEDVQQSVYVVERQQKVRLLAHFLLNTRTGRTLVFSRTKHGADRIVRQLKKAGVLAAAIHGDKSQGARTRSLQQFKSPNPPVLIATDIAARGLDIDEISHVINYDLPDVPETYVHRIGRTGRAGARGVAVSFCEPDQRSLLRAIERLIRRSIRLEEPVEPENFPPGTLPRRELPTEAERGGGKKPARFQQGRPGGRLGGRPGGRHGGSGGGEQGSSRPTRSRRRGSGSKGRA